MSSKFADFTYAFFDNLNMNHRDFLLKYMLNEAYQEVPFTKKQIKNTLQYVHINLKQNTTDEIIDDLNDEFLNIGVKLELVTKMLYNYQLLYPNSGIIGAEYNDISDLIIIYIMPIFITKFNNENFDLLATDLIGMLGHEETHKQQIQLSKNKVKGLNSDNTLSTIPMIKEYLSNPAEIDAHAREVAIYLYNKNFLGKQIVNYLIYQPSILKTVSNAYKKYFDLFKDKNRLLIEESDNIIWQRFLRRIIAYLQTTNKYKIILNPKEVLQKIK